ncbi:hypothetical protein B0H17DRAFT_530634 [Mycena rosella]|uniref:Uncharacterized protein n=1 Tax=Mycena rosella TaxID=1033263 RepID=A0AAD7MAF7_MYCRO|nr:hypothetical protein B0H17DRAFT_530634 [Mycena rosella]
MEPFSTGDANVARIIYQTNRTNNNPVASLEAPFDAAASSTALAPAIPDAVHEKAKRRTMQLGASIRAHQTDPSMTTSEALHAAADEWLKNLKSTQSPLTESARYKSLADWAAVLSIAEPTLSSERHWDRDIVHKYWPKFLFTLVNNTTPLLNKRTIKAATVSWWAGLFLHSIVVYTRDPDTKGKCGMALLIKDGIYQAIKAQVVQLVHDFRLDRHTDVKIYFGRHELQIIFNSMLQDSQNTGRQVAIQNQLRHLFPFYFTTRASSLGSTHKKWRDLNYVPLCGDVRVFVHGHLNWEILFRMKIHKNHIATAIGVEQNFKIPGVLLAHNIMFDMTVPFLSHLFLLGRFKVKYKTPQELFDDHSAELEIDPEFKDTPLFLESAPGGREFAVPEQAATARSAYQALRHSCQKTGLPRVGYTAIRRETGNIFSLQMGARIAKDVLNHTPDGPFRDSYSRNTANFDLVRIRLSEIAGTEETSAGEKSKENHASHAFMSAAVECLVRQGREAPDAEENSQVKAVDLKEEYKRKLIEKLPMKPLHQTRVAAWTNYLRCFNLTAQGYQMGTPQANRLFLMATGSKKPPKGESIPVAFKVGWTSVNVTLLRDTFLTAEKNFLDQQKKEMRTFKAGNANKLNHELVTGPLTGDAKERELVVQALASNNPSLHIQQAVDDAMARAAAPTKTDLESVKSWASNIRKAQSALSVLDAQDGPTTTLQEDEHDRLVAFFDRMTMSPATPSCPFAALPPLMQTRSSRTRTRTRMKTMRRRSQI